jgi:hypothetical protein
VDGDRLVAPADDQIRHQRQILHVIEMAVAHEDVVDLAELLERQRARERARVERQHAVHEEARGATRGKLTTMTA